MGYTVYFTHKRAFTTEEWGKIRAAVIPMFHRLKQIKGGNGEGRPVVDNSDIVFNGDASKGEDHETFLLSKVNSGFQFCKTARKPYDRYVKAVLLVAQHFAPGALDVSCDGDSEPDCWTEGKRIAELYLNDKNAGVATSGHIMNHQALIDAQKEVEAHDNDLKELEDTVELLAKLANGNRKLSFIANYLKGNMDDLKAVYEGP
jgi:hypothetical protein